jgi:hypothetical protein
MQEYATLTRVDAQMRQALEHAADQVEYGPARLKAAILAAAKAGERPADITRAIGHVWTYDYVAKIVREGRASQS